MHNNNMMHPVSGAGGGVEGMAQYDDDSSRYHTMMISVLGSFIYSIF